jgi:DNA-directed RNA polymerase specialized sigma24 family protein
VTIPEGSVNAGTIYRMHVHQVARWAARLGGPALDLEDTVHEVFAIACRRLSTFRGESSLSTWLFGITDKVVRHRRRKERWQRWLSGSANATDGHVESVCLDPLRVVERNQAARDVERSRSAAGPRCDGRWRMRRSDVISVTSRSQQSWWASLSA